MEAKGQLTYQWIQWPSVVTYWLSVEWWLSIGYLSVGYQSIGQVSTDISTNHQSTFGQQKVTIVPVVCPQCTGIGEPLVEYQYISVVYWSSIVSAETNLVPWCKHLDILISSLLWYKLHFPRLEYSKHFLRYTPPADTQIPPILAVFFEPLDNNNLRSVIPDRVK